MTTATATRVTLQQRRVVDPADLGRPLTAVLARSLSVAVVPVLLVLLAVTASVLQVTNGPVVPALLPLLAVAVALPRLRGPVPGPDIADRELDAIVAGAAGIAVVALVGVQLTDPGSGLGALAVAPAAVLVLALGSGTRRLWHLRALPALLVVGWPAWWSGLPDGPVEQGALGAVLVVGAGLGARFASRRAA